MAEMCFGPGSLVSRVVAVAACMAGLSPAASSAESPPAREPREKLTINGKEHFEGAQGIVRRGLLPECQAATSKDPPRGRVGRRNGPLCPRSRGRRARADRRRRRQHGSPSRLWRAGRNAPRPFGGGPAPPGTRLGRQGRRGKARDGPCSVRVSVPEAASTASSATIRGKCSTTSAVWKWTEGRVYVSMIPGRDGRGRDRPLRPRGPGASTRSTRSTPTFAGKTRRPLPGVQHGGRRDRAGLPGLPWPIFWFYCTGGAFNPIRIADDGKIEIACIRQWFTLRPGDRPENLHGREDRAVLVSQAALDPTDRLGDRSGGVAYYRDAEQGAGAPPSVVIRKVNIATSKPVSTSRTTELEKLSEKATTSRGRPTRRQRCPDRLPQRLRFSS